MINEHVIEKQVELLREYYKIGIYPDKVKPLCNECDLENYLFSLRNNLYYEQIMFCDLDIDSPYHRASILGFPSEEGIEWFLIDPTYGQFFKNKKFANYMFSNYRSFSLSLLNNGYIVCTIENIYNYINGFIFSKAFSNNIDKELVYSNLYNLLIDINMINKNKINSYKKKKSN